MDASTAKRVALMASFGAGAATAVGQIATTGSWPELRVVVGTFGLAVITTAVAEVSPNLAASIALTILATALFVLNDAPWQAIGNLAKPRPMKN